MNILLSKLFFIILFTGIFTIASLTCHAQALPDPARKSTTIDTASKRNAAKDTIHLSHIKMPVNQDSLAFALRPHPYQPNPKKAGLYSAILPGLGQAYNHQYWKVPVVYAGVVVAEYFIANNLNKYRDYRRGYISRVNNPNFVDHFTTDLHLSPDQLVPYLKQNQDDYSKYLDLTVLFTGVGYFLQVVDAITSAHLKNFDISRDISMHLKPIALPNGVGLGLVMNLK